MRFRGYLVARGWSHAARPAPWRTIWIAKSPIPAAPFGRNPRHRSARLLLNHPRNQLLPELPQLLAVAICLLKIWLSLRIAMPGHQSQTRLLVLVARQRNAMPDFAQPRLDRRRDAPGHRPGQG